MSRERIIYLSAKDPRSRKSWSGIPYFMFQSLQEHYDIEYVPGPKLQTESRLLYYVSRALTFLSGRKFTFDYGRITAWLFARHYSRALKKVRNVKFIFVPAGLTEISELRTDIPLVAVGDCSMLQLFDYYPATANISSLCKRDVERVERNALVRCAKIIFSSDWASDFCRQHYKVTCDTVPFGANIEISEVPARRSLGPGCRLLVVGVDWVRKGGETAVEIHRELIRKSIDSTLTIVGMKPPNGVDAYADVQFTYINKDSEQGVREYIELLRNADFLLLPTVADCTPIVIAEAFAAGLPVLATRTGGVASMIEEGVTGFLFEPKDSSSYAVRIMQLISEPAAYAEMSDNCRSASIEVFNWTRWASEIKKLCAPL